MFAVFTWTIPKNLDKKKQNMLIKVCKELLGTCIKSKKTA